MNGRELKGSDEIFRLFDGTAGKAVVLKVGKDPRSSRSAISMALRLMVRGGASRDLAGNPAGINVRYSSDGPDLSGFGRSMSSRTVASNLFRKPSECATDSLS